jgi:hypothetical protein
MIFIAKIINIIKKNINIKIEQNNDSQKNINITTIVLKEYQFIIKKIV